AELPSYFLSIDSSRKNLRFNRQWSMHDDRQRQEDRLTLRVGLNANVCDRSHRTSACSTSIDLSHTVGLFASRFRNSTGSMVNSVDVPSNVFSCVCPIMFEIEVSIVVSWNSISADSLFANSVCLF